SYLWRGKVARPGRSDAASTSPSHPHPVRNRESNRGPALMVRAIIAWSLHNRLIVVLAVLGLIAAGIHSALNLNVEAYPDPTPPRSPTGDSVRSVLEGPGYTTNQLKAVQDWVLNRALKQVPGVIDVTGYGGTVKQYQVLLDTRLMRQYGIILSQVEDAIQRS